MSTSSNGVISHNFERLGRIDVEGGGQVVVHGNYAYIGHIKPPHGTTIVDVSDPRHPKIVSQILLQGGQSHSHKARLLGDDLMIVNSEMDNRHHLRKGFQIPEVTQRLKKESGKAPNDADIARALGVEVGDMPMLRNVGERGYQEGGFKIYDVSDRSQPKLVHFEQTPGVGVHRFDCDDRYAYISTEKEGFHGNILRIYDLQEPTKPQEIGNWWMPGQHVAAGDKPDWPGYDKRLHHAMRVGDRFYASCWYAGFSILDASDLTNVKSLGSYDYHPPTTMPTHTIMPLAQPIGGRQIAVVVDEEHTFHHGELHAGMWCFDITNPADMKPLSFFYVSEADVPWSQKGGRFGAHQFQEHLDDTLVFCTWFSGGLRAIDVSNPERMKEVGFFIPGPGKGHTVPQSNDVDRDARGLIFLLDRLNGLDILEFKG